MMGIQLLVILLVMLLVAAMIGVGVGAILVYLRDQNPERERPVIVSEGDDSAQKWSIELWDIERGVRYSAAFSGGITLGRTIPGWIPNGLLPVGDDQTISHEQCLVYSQGESLYLWNLGKANPTRLNDALVSQPEILRVGDRITMGSRRYLLTSLVRM